MFCTLLDATKAFDRVAYCNLFRSLMNRNLPSTVLRLLLNMHAMQVTIVSRDIIGASKFKVGQVTRTTPILRVICHPYVGLDITYLCK